MKKSLVNGLKKALLAVSVMAAVAAVSPKSVDRSEERRVGKECRL